VRCNLPNLHHRTFNDYLEHPCPLHFYLITVRDAQGHVGDAQMWNDTAAGIPQPQD